MRIARICAVAVSLFVTGLAHAGAALAADPAAPAPALSFVTSGAPPLALPFKADGTTNAATLSVAILNGSSTDTSVSLFFLDDATGMAYAAGDPSRPTSLSITGTSSQSPAALTVPGGQVISLTLMLRVPAATNSLSGILVGHAAQPTIGPATIAVKGTFKDLSNQFAKAKAEPGSVTVTATRILPFVAPDTEHPWTWCWTWPTSESISNHIRLTGVGPPPPAGTDTVLPHVLLGSDTGGRLFARLSRPTSDPEGETHLQIGCADRTGTYKGILPFDAANKDASSLDVTIKVQDLFFWPLAAVLLGSLLAYLFKTRGDRGRPEGVLRLALEDARDAIVAAKKEAEPPDRKLMDAIFDPIHEVEGGKGLASDLFAAVGEAKTKEKLDALADEIADLVKAGTLFTPLAEARKALRKQMEDWPADSRSIATAINEAGATLLKGAEIESLGDATAHLDAVKDQMKANTAWQRAYVLADYASKRYAALPGTLPAWIAERADLANPVAVVEAYLRPATSLKELQDGKVMEQLHERLATIELAHSAARKPSAQPSGQQPRPGITSTEGHTREAAVVTPPPVVTALLSALAGIEIPFLSRRRTAEDRLRQLRLGDTWEFVFVAFLAAAAFLGTAYVGKAFGTTWDYLAAFVAGAAGTVAINFTLLPWYRSYTVTRAKKS